MCRPKGCYSRSHLCSANSSGLCRPPWSNAYKYRPNPCCTSRVRPPRLHRPPPCAVCKAYTCICSNQSPARSPKSSKMDQSWANNFSSCGSNALKIARKFSCGCEVIKIPEAPITLVREFLVKDDGAPIPTDKCFRLQKIVSSLRSQSQSTKVTENDMMCVSPEQQEFPKEAGKSDAGQFPVFYDNRASVHILRPFHFFR